MNCPAHFPVMNLPFGITAETRTDTEPHPLLPSMAQHSGPPPHTMTAGRLHMMMPSTSETMPQLSHDATASMDTHYTIRHSDRADNEVVAMGNPMATNSSCLAKHVEVPTALHNTTPSKLTFSHATTTQPANGGTLTSNRPQNEPHGGINVSQSIPRSDPFAEGIKKSADFKVHLRASSSHHRPLPLRGNGYSDASTTGSTAGCRYEEGQHELSQSDCSDSGSQDNFVLCHSPIPEATSSSGGKLFLKGLNRNTSKEHTEAHSEGESQFINTHTSSPQAKASSGHRLSPISNSAAAGSYRTASKEGSKLLHTSPPSSSSHRFSMRRRSSSASKAEVVSAGTQTLNCESIGVQTEAAGNEIAEGKAVSNPKASSPIETLPRTSLKDKEVPSVNQQPAIWRSNTTAPMSTSLQQSRNGNARVPLALDDLTGISRTSNPPDISRAGGDLMDAARAGEPMSTSSRAGDSPSKPTVHVVAGGVASGSEREMDPSLRSTSSGRPRLRNANGSPELCYPSSRALLQGEVAGTAHHQGVGMNHDTEPGSEDLMLSAVLNLQDKESVMGHSGYRLRRSHTESESYPRE